MFRPICMIACKKTARLYTSAHKNVIKEITIMASVRQGWQRKSIELFAAFKYNYLKSILWQYDRGADSQHRSEKAADSICSELPGALPPNWR